MVVVEVGSEYSGVIIVVEVRRGGGGRGGEGAGIIINLITLIWQMGN